jgi:purine-nucleoside phosphorylase
MASAIEQLMECARQRPLCAAIVLGSGLGDIARRVQLVHSMSFEEMPGFAPTTVAGHASRLLVGDWCGQRVLVFCGRIHGYEGHSREQIVAPIRLAATLGAREIFLTNAAGGIREDLTPGTLLSIRAHLDLTMPAFWRGGVQFPAHCSARLHASLLEVSSRLGVEVREGTYGAVLGPNYETPAEIRTLRSLGVDAVGMSTAAEIEAAAELGLECLAISCITNRAAGLSASRLTHEEVLANSQRQAQRLGDLIEGVICQQEV